MFLTHILWLLLLLLLLLLVPSPVGSVCMVSVLYSGLLFTPV